MIEIHCKPLISKSVSAKCKLNTKQISCESPVPPQTDAELTCKNKYRPEIDPNLLSTRRNNVRCNENGQWEPEPMKCIPGPLTINIYINDTQLTLHTTFDRNNSTLIEVLDDRIIIHTNVKNPNYPDTDIRGPKPNNNTVTDDLWAWS